MSDLIFWDVDTQYDFIMPDGKLYIQGAEGILPRLAELTSYARRSNIPIFGSVDYHASDDAELSEDPDFQATFPPHCLQGERGQEKVAETIPAGPLWIGTQPLGQVVDEVRGHSGEVFFRKQQFDVFTNPNVDPVLNAIAPKRIVLYGVALDVCNAFAINGFLDRNTAPISLVLDATQAIDTDRGNRFVEEWKQRGIRVVSTKDVVSGGIG